MPRGKGKRGAVTATGGRKRARNQLNEVDSRPQTAQRQNREPAVHFPPPPQLGISPFDDLISPPTVIPHLDITHPQFSPPANSPTSTPTPTFQIVTPPTVIPHPDITHPSVFIPLGSCVPQKIKEKIWASEFLDLGILLKSQRQLNEISESGPAGEVQFREGRFFVKPHEQESSKLSIDQWTSAFIMYTSIFLERFPMRAQELLKYLRDIRLASTRSPTWWQYDDQFRHLQASNPSNHWGVINVELWLLYVSGSPATQYPVRLTTSTNSSTQQKFVPSKSHNNVSPSSLTCNFFNTGRHCRFTNCRYKHACQLCGGNHRRTVCRSSQQQ